MSDGDLGRIIELERADAARSVLEQAAQKLEGYATNELYSKVLKKAARLIRELKNEC